MIILSLLFNRFDPLSQFMTQPCKVGRAFPSYFVCNSIQTATIGKTHPTLQAGLKDHHLGHDLFSGVNDFGGKKILIII